MLVCALTIKEATVQENHRNETLATRQHLPSANDSPIPSLCTLQTEPGSHQRLTNPIPVHT